MITLRIPTKDQYAFVELQLGIPEKLSEDYMEQAKQVKVAYDSFIQTFQSENKYSETTFNEMIVGVMDSDLTDWQITTDDYQHLTESQQKVYQSIKRFRKRLPEDNE